MPDSKVLGRNYPRVDAADKVSGRSQYASDIYLPGMLLCKVLQSPKPHARILHIDTSRAQGLPGVRAVITGRDVPDAHFGNGAVKDKRILALDKVRYIGEPVAAYQVPRELTRIIRVHRGEWRMQEDPERINCRRRAHCGGQRLG